MSFNLSSYFLPFRDRSASLATQFGLPEARSLVVVKRSAASVTYLEIDPRPNISRMNPKLIDFYSKLSSVQLELDDFQVFISKTYTQSQIDGRGVSYLVDATLIGGVPSGGIECDRILGMDIEEQDLHWKLLLRRRT